MLAYYSGICTSLKLSHNISLVEINSNDVSCTDKKRIVTQAVKTTPHID